VSDTGFEPGTAFRMRAVVYDTCGPPDVLRLEDVERPVPRLSLMFTIAVPVESVVPVAV
jgi:hypothetical protein